MKVYIAAHSSELATEVAKKLEQEGFNIISTWHKEPMGATSEYTPEDRRKIANLDAAQVTEADILFLLESPFKVSGGKFVEAGIALGQGKPVVVIGRRENMLLWHTLVLQFDTVEAFIATTNRPI